VTKKIKGVLRGFSPKQSFGKEEVLGEGKTFDLTKGCPSPKNKKLAWESSHPFVVRQKALA